MKYKDEVDVRNRRRWCKIVQCCLKILLYHQISKEMSDNAAPASQVYGGNGFPHVGSPQYNGLSNPHGLGMVRPHGNCSDEQYLHYSQGGVRPGHPDGLSMSKGPRLLPPGRHGPGWGSMNCNPNQQRYMPPNMMGPSSEPGTTPTLNHLLQSSNSDQRYPGMPYNEYNMVSQKMNSEEMANQHGIHWSPTTAGHG